MPRWTDDAAVEHRQLIADEFAGAVGQDGPAAVQACPLLLAASGGEAPHAALFGGMLRATVRDSVFIANRRKPPVPGGRTICEKILCPEGPTGYKRVYAFAWRKAKKLIPVDWKLVPAHLAGEL